MVEKIHNPRRYFFWGLVFILLGVLWRLSLMGWFELSSQLLLPALLIIFGLALMISGFLRRRPQRPEAPQPPPGGGTA